MSNGYWQNGYPVGRLRAQYLRSGSSLSFDAWKRAPAGSGPNAGPAPTYGCSGGGGGGGEALGGYWDANGRPVGRLLEDYRKAVADGYTGTFDQYKNERCS